MMITRENYEIWFLDYLEERLTPEEEELVRLFAQEHPDLAEELEAFVPALTVDETLVYPSKEQLKRSLFEDTSYLENQVIAAMEGDLAEADRLKLELWLSRNPAAQDLAQLLYQCRLHPSPDIRFPHKERLKKKATLAGYFSRIAAVAAILLIALLLFYPREKVNQPVALASAESSVKLPELPGISSKGDVDIQLPGRTTKSIPVVKRLTPSSGNTTTKQNGVKSLPPPERLELALLPMNPKIAEAFPMVPLNGELAPLKETDLMLLANIEMPISDFLKGRAQELKAIEDYELFSRNKVVIAGLNFVSKLTGKNLTGKKGEDGRLRTISFNTQLLAVSIPVNRSL
jgi:hypothetical protein